MEKKEYCTIRQRAQDEFVEKRSRFIGAAAPVQTEEEAMDFINEKRAEYWDANHNVYAFVLRDGQTRRYSDDGEPQGTAGVPVLDCILKEGVCDVVVVVTRYFGGTLLGAGGLVRAYSHGASLAINAAQRKVMSVCKRICLDFEYSMYGKISYLLPKFSVNIEDSDFGVAVHMQLLMKADQVVRFQKELDELSGGTIYVQQQEELYAEIL